MNTLSASKAISSYSKLLQNSVLLAKQYSCVWKAVGGASMRGEDNPWAHQAAVRLKVSPLSTPPASRRPLHIGWWCLKQEGKAMLSGLPVDQGPALWLVHLLITHCWAPHCLMPPPVMAISSWRKT